MVGEDVEDHRGPVDYRHSERGLEISLLPGRKLVVTGDQIRTGALDFSPCLLQLAVAEIAIRVRLAPPLDHLPRGHDARRAQQLSQFIEISFAGSVNRDHQSPLPGTPGDRVVGRDPAHLLSPALGFVRGPVSGIFH